MGDDVHRRASALTGAVALVTLTPALVILPTVTPPGAGPEPVPGALRSFAVSGVDGAAWSVQASGAGVPTALQRRPAALTAQRTTKRFDLVALTWTGATPAGTTFRVRVRESGRWSPWQALEVEDHAPDARREVSAATRAPATAPLLTTGADGVQVRVDSSSGAAPAGLRAVLVDGGRSTADSGSPVLPASTAAAATPRPSIITRRSWGADERLVKEPPQIDARVSTLFIHHTDTTNSYTAKQAYAQVRAVYLFHTRSRGWNDIGYNFLVDRFGRVFEGRRGSMTQAVHGAHTGGFNTDAMGVAVLGGFSRQRPTPAALRGVVDVVSWKASQYLVNPRGSTAKTSAGGGGVKFPRGKRVLVRNLSGHRDVYFTECPGNDLYPYLPTIRTQAAARMIPALNGATLSARMVNWSGSPITFSAVAPTNQRWWFSATPICSRTPVTTSSGTTVGRISARWDPRDGSSSPARPGVYRVATTSSSPVGSVGYAADVEVLPTLDASAAQCRVARLATPDAFTSSVLAGRSRYPDANSVVIAGAGAVLDGLVAAPLARVKGAPLLLSSPRALPPVVAQDIRSRGVRTAYIVGGASAVGAAVQTQLGALGVSTVVRLTGRDRYGVAAAVARQVGAGAQSAVVVSGTSLTDAAAAAGPAAATRRPLLLVTPAAVPAVTGNTLRALGVRNVAVVGTAAAVPRRVLSQLGAYGVTRRLRVAGTDGPSTAVAVAKAFANPVPAGQVVLVPAAPSAWSVIGAAQGRLTVFAAPSGLPGATSAWLAARKPGSVALVAPPRSASTALIRQTLSTI
jgi:putative cell wall-binding protein